MLQTSFLAQPWRAVRGSFNCRDKENALRKRSILTSILLLLLATMYAQADTVPVGQFGITYPSANASTGYYAFTIANLTGNTTYGPGACSPGYPVCSPIEFTDATLTVNWAYGQIDPNTGVVTSLATGAGESGTFTATALDTNSFDPSYNGCGTYGVDAGCAGTDDTNNAFQLTLPITDSSGNNLVILSATFTATSVATTTNVGTLSGPYTATMNPTTDCGGPCNFNDPGLYDGDPNVGYWEYYDASVDIVTNTPTPGNTVPEPGTVWFLLTGVGWLGWRRRRFGL